MIEKADIAIGRHDERLSNVEKKVKALEDCMNEIKTNVNRILGGIVIACVLLSVNIVLMLTGLN